MSDKNYPKKRDCEHGFLRGSCPHCDNLDLELENECLKQRNEDLERECEEYFALFTRTRVAGDALRQLFNTSELIGANARRLVKEWDSLVTSLPPNPMSKREYRIKRESFMHGVYWRDVKVLATQIDIDKAAYEYANKTNEGA